MCDNQQQQQRQQRHRRRSVFVVGCAVERVLDWQQLDCDRAVRNALTDAGLERRGGLISAGCVDRALQDVRLPLAAGGPVFNVCNRTNNSAKTLLLARQLIAVHGIDCCLAIGVDRSKSQQHRVTFERRRLAALDSTRRLIRDFDLVQRRNRIADAELWEQSEDFQVNWCSDDVLVACVLANEEFVQRNRLDGRAVEIVDMEIAAAAMQAEESHLTPRMINALGFLGDSTPTAERRARAMEKTSLVHCVERCKALREMSRNTDGQNDGPFEGESNNATAEVLLAQYARYAGPATPRAKL